MFDDSVMNVEDWERPILISLRSALESNGNAKRRDIRIPIRQAFLGGTRGVEGSVLKISGLERWVLETHHRFQISYSIFLSIVRDVIYVISYFSYSVCSWNVEDKEEKRIASITILFFFWFNSPSSSTLVNFYRASHVTLLQTLE